VLTPAEQRAAYEQDGYLVFPELLDATKLAALRSALAEVLRDAEGLTETNDKFSITRTEDGGYSCVASSTPSRVTRRSMTWS
jgi:hypothetical protein